MQKNTLITLDFPPRVGGVAQYLQALTEQFPDEFRVVSSAGSYDGPVEFHAEPLLWSWVRPKWLRACRVMWKYRRETIRLWVSHVLPIGLAAWLMRPFTRTPYVVILHGMDFALSQRSGWKRWTTRQVLQGADKVFCNTNALCARVQAVVPSAKTHTLYPPLPNHHKTPSPKTHAKHDSLKLLTIARLVPRKNHQRVLDALKDVDHVHWTIVGSGPEEHALRNRIDTLGITDRVDLITHATASDLVSAYTNADVFILPVEQGKYDREGFGIVYLEAAYAGLPIIATALEGVNEALPPGGGVYLKEPTIEAIQEAITLLQDAGERAKMSQENRAFAEQFAPERVFGTIADYVRG